MPGVTDISCYCFAPLENLKLLRGRLLARCGELGLKGTILLSPEGINLFVAGERGHVDALVAEIRSVPGLENLMPKYSESESRPFTRMLVRIKKEIIAFGVEGIEPGRRTSPKLPAAALKQWLDEGRPLTLLDTRNDYEIKLGTFEGALGLGIKNFRQFPAAAEKLPAEMKDQAVVMFCTGGIRCEKAGPFMEKIGFKNIFQLDGGILKYFEECGGSHYRGECFVFDHRVGVDPALRETDSAQCHACRSPLTPEEQSDPRYVAGESCPSCFRTSGEKMRATIAAREELLHNLPPPGGNAGIRILHEDEAVIVVDKPAPLPMQPAGRLDKKTLRHFLAQAYAPQRPGPAHGLDAYATGVVVWTRIRRFAKLLQPQFADGRVGGICLVRARGHPGEDAFTSPIEENNLAARTEFRVLKRHGDGTALLEARPFTGCANQIPAQLRQLGLPVCGDTNRQPLCLHSWKISFFHPLTKERVHFESPAPSWALHDPQGMNAKQVGHRKNNR